MSATFRVALLVALATVGPGCGRSVEEAARESFSRKHSCPVDRITVTRRPDLTERTLRARRDLKAVEIPAELKAHPELHAKVQAAEEMRRKYLEELHTRPLDRKPPPEIAADRERLALWQKEQAAEQARLDQRDRERPFAQVEGCGEKALYECSASRKRPDHFSCSPSSHEP